MGLAGPSLTFPLLLVEREFPHHVKRLLFLYFISFLQVSTRCNTKQKPGKLTAGPQNTLRRLIFVTFGISFPIHPDTFLFALSFSASLKREKVPFNMPYRCSGYLSRRRWVSTSSEGNKKGDLVRQVTK